MEKEKARRASRKDKEPHQYNGPLEAVDCDIHSVRYDIMLECCWRLSQIGPHQVTYDAVAWLIHQKEHE
eukprot:scaffold1663_cov182-Skeletonema_marinoi.AAC.6